MKSTDSSPSPPRLKGVRVLITRAQDQQAGLRRRLENEAAEVLSLPCVKIESISDRTAARAGVRFARTADIAIFSSVNAVKFALPLAPLPWQGSLIAVGNATARALRAAGAQNLIVPPLGSSEESQELPARGGSEELLELPALQNASHRLVAILCGQRGRELLPTELRRRRAAVAAVELYRRVLPKGDMDLSGAATCDAVMTTSSEILGNFLSLSKKTLGERERPPLLIVNSERGARRALSLGYDENFIETAASASNLDMIQALVRRLTKTAEGA